MFFCMLRAGLASLALSLTGVAAQAADPQPVQQHNSNAIWFENWVGLSSATMTVQAPDGRIERIEAATGTPVYRLDPSSSIDGVYRYEISAATEDTVEIVNPMNDGRGDNSRTTSQKPFYLNGRFVVARNVIITPEDIQEE